MPNRTNAAPIKRNVIQTTLFDFNLTPPESRAGEVLYVNSVKFYNLMPRGITNARTKKRRGGGVDAAYRTLQKVEIPFTLYEHAYVNTITPARVTRTERAGNVICKYDIDVYPGRREQMLEWAVRLAARENGGTAMFGGQAGATFTLYRLQQICAELGQAMSYAQIREGLEVAHHCNIETRCADSIEDRFTASSPIFPTLGEFERRGDRGRTQIFVTFHPFVTAGIGKLDFRQVDIKRLASYPGAIDRWLYLKLIHDYTYADGVPGGPTFNLKASTIIACSGAGPYLQTREGIAAVRASLGRLATAGDIEGDWAERPHLTARGGVADVTFDIRAARTLAREIKAANEASKQTGHRLAAHTAVKAETDQETARRVAALKGPHAV